MSRTPNAPIDPLFIERWSTRTFDPRPLEPGTVERLVEAARWSPSCFNEQPWRFHVADEEPGRSKLLGLLGAWNQSWASRAPLLLFVVARRHFAHNGKLNRWAAFDTGAAWMALTLQARLLGLYTHAMGGYDLERAYEVLDLDPDQDEIIAAVAVGRRGSPEGLPEDIAEQEAEGPNGRRNPRDLLVRVS